MPRWRRSSRQSGWWSGPLVATRAHSRSCDGACRTLSTLLLAAEKSSDLEVREAAMDVYLAAASVEKTEATAGLLALIADGSADPTARKWYYQALREISGKDFGESPAEWQNWWATKR